MELAIQDRLFLGGENQLGLSLDTDAVYAEYQIGGAEYQLLLIQYPDAAGAQAGLQALNGGAAEDLLKADLSGTLLGAVFGQAAGAGADSLLAQALGK